MRMQEFGIASPTVQYTHRAIAAQLLCPEVASPLTKRRTSTSHIRGHIDRGPQSTKGVPPEDIQIQQLSAPMDKDTPGHRSKKRFLGLE